MRTMVGTAAALAILFVSMPARGEVRVGALAGANIATLHANMEDPDVIFSAKTFLGAGAVVEVGLSRHLSVQLEPMYLQKGGKILLRDFFGSDASASVRLSYVELPVLLKVSKATGRMRPYLILGPSVGYRTSVRVKDETTGEEEDPADADQNLRKLDFGVSAGAGLAVPAGRATVFVESRYTWGLVNLDKETEDPDLKLNNRGIQVLAGFTFPIGRR
jgi:outer membrane protein with beta-barrel domain